ncbi:histidine kinase [Erythrobacter litoralis]|uniref:sensor histidine kinase n=1 Tax=Erythrobacter litoralis TaxID=39960 RepID=UPI00243547D7|nr:CHASE3 domain-containing protein [Erythrobacter litoralis]MDG6079117.1 histidine kinase [Erythrobacter litoralis]
MAAIPFAHLGRRWPNVVILLLIGGMMFALIFLVWQTLESERDTREQSRQTDNILLELRNVHTAALNAETGQRGYLLTLDRRYLEPYQLGREQIEPALERLRTAVETDSTQRQSQLLDQIDALARAKFAEMQTTVEQSQSGGLIEARRTILTDEGQEMMQRLRRSIREMERIERDIFAQQLTDTARAESRVLPLLGMLILLLLFAIIFGARLVSRAAKAEAEASQASAIGEARDRADLLARELNHRVKNLFAVILAIVQMSARDKPEAKAVTESISQRIRALLTAHEVSQGELDRQVASLAALVETTLAPYESSRKTSRISGPDIHLPAKQVTPLGLVLHELTTNAVKYGAWANDGTIDVSWERKDDDNIRFVWRERGAKVTGEPESTGFGSLLMTSAARQFGGTVERQFGPDGIEVVIEIPTSE